MAKRDNIRLRNPTKERFHPNPNVINGTLSDDCSSLWSFELDNVKKKKEQKRQDEKREEIGGTKSVEGLFHLPEL